MRYLVFVILALPSLYYLTSFLPYLIKLSDFVRGRVDASRYLGQWEFLSTLGALLVLGVLAGILSTGTDRTFDYRGIDLFVLGSWHVVFVASPLFLMGLFQIIVSSEGISFTALGRCAFHMLMLVACFHIWSLYSSIPLTTVVYHTPEIAADPQVLGDHSVPAKARPLYVVIHGLSGHKAMDPTCDLIRHFDPDCEIIKLKYLRHSPLASRLLPMGTSNWDAFQLSREIEQAVDRYDSKGNFSEIHLVGHSAGAVLIRKAYLIGSGACSEINVSLPPGTEPKVSNWTNKVRKVVLLAGLNRGVQISGTRPADMSAIKHFAMWCGVYVSEMAGVGKFVRDLETGAPMIANLRLDSIAKHAKGNPLAGKVEIIQILGDIDDIVSFEDSHDLASVDELPSATFKTYKMTGTGHNEIVRLAIPPRDDESQAVADNEPRAELHRGRILQQALGLPRLGNEARVATTLKSDAEMEQYVVRSAQASDVTVSHVVIVLHGIRDYGRWSSTFVDELAAPNRQVENPRYGYFGLGSFLIGSAREKYVKWLMDEITELRAQYPNATFDFVGHSNGTYLFAKAISDYESLRVRHVVFAGSVVNHGYDWGKLLPENRNQVQHVVNITADKDWVVGLFPRAFEVLHYRQAYWQPIGAAGYTGFAAAEKHPDFVTQFQIHGEHSAFHDIIPLISSYLSNPPGGGRLDKEAERAQAETLRTSARQLKQVAESHYPKADASPGLWGLLQYWCFSLLVFLAIIAGVITIGIFVVQPARQYAFQVAVLYIGVVIWLLQRL
ncbi:MAG: hypothetical protein AAFX06_00710 [Planctomycetota bacterium]